LIFTQIQLNSRIQAGITEAGFNVATPIQEQAIPPILDGRDLLGLAQTGTGKTAAYVLPILQRLSVAPRRKVRALVLAPTRELAEQIHQDCSVLGRFSNTRSTAVYGGVNKNRQIASLRKGAEIVIACPGRLLDLLGERQIDLSAVEVVVLDEADRMCDMGFLPDVKRILERLPDNRQTLFFSATMPREIRALAEAMLDHPIEVKIGRIAPVDSVSHSLYPVRGDQKKRMLFAMLAEKASGQVLVFTRTKHKAKGLAIILKKRHLNAAALQGNMSQSQRQDAINGFRSGKYDILIATDIASRGIDVTGISHVINFDMPDTVDAYTHRIGRTGRADRSGSAHTFATPEDHAMLRAIEKSIGRPIEKSVLPDFDYEDFEPEKQFAVARPVQGRKSTQPRSHAHRYGPHGAQGRRRPQRSSPYGQ